MPLPRVPTYIWAAVLGAPTVGGAWYVSKLENAPFTQRSRFIAISLQQERQLGEEAFRQVKKQEHGKILGKDHGATQVVQRVGKRIASCSGYGGSGSGFDWEFIVVDSPEQINAFALPGGKVCVYSGLLKACQNEDMLAAVLAYEAAHAIARHGAEKMSAAIAFEGAVVLLALFGIESTWALRALTHLLLELPNSRTCESEADYIGLRLMAKACFKPSAAVPMFERLEKLEKGPKSSRAVKYLSTHPALEDRVDDIRQWLSDPELQQLYRMNDCARKRKTLQRQISA